MKPAFVMTLGVLLTTAGIALAHSGVKNAAVKARMDSMGRMAEATKTLGLMARGTVPFDAASARTAANALTAEVSLIPQLFEAPEQDPKSEALPGIWTSWPDFTLKSKDAMQAAQAAQDVSNVEDLGIAIARIGKSCKSCHAVFRLKN